MNDNVLNLKITKCQSIKPKDYKMPEIKGGSSSSSFIGTVASLSVTSLSASLSFCFFFSGVTWGSLADVMDEAIRFGLGLVSPTTPVGGKVGLAGGLVSSPASPAGWGWRGERRDGRDGSRAGGNCAAGGDF
jgi:hypothetical protein